MERRFYFILLILSLILLIDICPSSAISSKLHVRKKRLINSGRPQIVINSIRQVPYIVNLLKDRKPGYCAGTILSPINIITAGHCVAKPAKYEMVSNSILVGQGTIHNVTHINVHEQYNPHTRENDLALVKIAPAIDFVRSGNRPIPLHNERDPITSVPVISGWGCTGFTPVKHEPVFPRELKSMTLPIINEKLCKRLYPSEADNIDERVICARDPHGLKTSCFGDSGNPLVANNRLLGIMVWSANFPHPHYPDFFIKVYHHKYVQWINQHLRPTPP